MRGRIRLWVLFGTCVLSLALILFAAGHLISVAAAPVWVTIGGVFFALTATLAPAFLALDLSFIRPAALLARDLRLLLHGNPERPVLPPRGHALGRLPDAVAALATRFRDAEARHREEVGAATARAAEQRSRLEAVLTDLQDGIIGCSVDLRILLFNDGARRILGPGAPLGLDRPLDPLIARAPIAQAFELLRERHAQGDAASKRGPHETFVCATADGQRLLRCRMTLITTADGDLRGLILDFTDATETLAQGQRQLSRLGKLVEELRAPAASLAAAAEVLGAHQDLAEDERAGFIDVVARESDELGAKLAEVDVIARALSVADWPMDDLLSADLARRVARRLEAHGDGPRLAHVGPALWLHGDGHHLALLLEHLARRLGDECGAKGLDLEIRQGERRVELDLVWSGPAIHQGLIDRWLDEPLDPAHGASRLRDVLARHDSEIWSQAHAREGAAVLRILLPRPERPQASLVQAVEPALPARPEFYDFDLLERARDVARPLLDRPLAALNYIVFDTETTGLNPRGRDEIVQLAAVRIVNRRLLSGETFDRLVNPGRPIPKASIRFHGITDEMVRGRPPIEVVLPQFLDFAYGSVLVAHNAAFDVAFLKKSEARAGVRFEQPVVDTLLLSAILHRETEDHALDGIAERFGVAVVDRHRALGDALVTAEIFLRMLPLLEAEGIVTLGDALAASEQAVELRRRQTESFGTVGATPLEAVREA